MILYLLRNVWITRLIILYFLTYHRIMVFYGFCSIGEYEVLTSVNLKPWSQKSWLLQSVFHWWDPSGPDLVNSDRKTAVCVPLLLFTALVFLVLGVIVCSWKNEGGIIFRSFSVLFLHHHVSSWMWKWVLGGGGSWVKWMYVDLTQDVLCVNPSETTQKQTIGSVGTSS